MKITIMLSESAGMSKEKFDKLSMADKKAYVKKYPNSKHAQGTKPQTKNTDKALPLTRQNLAKELKKIANGSLKIHDFKSDDGENLVWVERLSKLKTGDKTIRLSVQIDKTKVTYSIRTTVERPFGKFSRIETGKSALDLPKSKFTHKNSVSFTLATLLKNKKVAILLKK